jgi:glycosyltransferase involved in cell wall biosynthesis
VTRVDLFWLGEPPPPEWALGRVVRSSGTVADLHRVIESERPRSRDAAWLFWGARLGAPDAEHIRRAFDRPGDVWHAGLRLGMRGRPQSIDYVAPTWMLNRDPDPEIEATSWRLSLEACLVRPEVVLRLGGIRPEFATLSGASLEAGHRWVTRGALLRHVPGLLPQPAAPTVSPTPEDEMRFIRFRFGRFWLRWSLMRAVLRRELGAGSARALLRRLEREAPGVAPEPFRSVSPSLSDEKRAPSPSVTVLVPTVDRYPYLEKLLEQLAGQTVPPLEVLIVDQTAADRRRTDFAERFPSLPIRLFQLDRPGQCSSRNQGLEASRGDLILFLDDDDEVPPDLIENHLEALQRFGGEVSCGVAEEDGAGPVPEAFRLIRTSDVFPTNNSLIVKRTLERSGLFDLAYDRGSRADGDLGMRLYLAGALMVLNPGISVLHHHAPSGGLRIHKARVITYASSRKRLTHRHLPATTEIYLSRRYFSVRQVREMLWLSAAGTFSVRGSRWRKLAKSVVSLALLPHSLWEIRSRRRVAEEMLARFPQIPSLSRPKVAEAGR